MTSDYEIEERLDGLMRDWRVRAAIHAQDGRQYQAVSVERCERELRALRNSLRSLSEAP